MGLGESKSELFSRMNKSFLQYVDERPLLSFGAFDRSLSLGTLNVLPAEILVMVFTCDCFDYISLCHMSIVSKGFHYLLKDDQLWQKHNMMLFNYYIPKPNSFYFLDNVTTVTGKKLFRRVLMLQRLNLPANTIRYDSFVKAVFKGESGCGKTELIRSLTWNVYDFHPNPIASNDNMPTNFHTLHYYDGEANVTTRIQLWDIPEDRREEQRFAIRGTYWRGSRAAIFVYDISSPTSFHETRAFLDEFHYKYIESSNIDCRILVGHKSDLGDMRVVPQEEAIALACQYQMMYLETSCKEPETIAILRRILIDKALDVMRENQAQAKSPWA